jgi:REP element-mobilizing transposase RayT
VEEGHKPFGIDKQSLEVRQGAYLPHWEQDRAIYHVVGHVIDSLPAVAAQRLREERDGLLRRLANGEELCAVDAKRLRALRYEATAELLDAGHGCCPFRDPKNAKIVFDALWHFAGDRYLLHACCVMPNHFHAVVEPIDGLRLNKILHSWKSVTAHRILPLSSFKSHLWQKEGFDHIIRSEASYCKALAYVAGNPAAAGLVDWPWVWRKPL